MDDSTFQNLSEIAKLWNKVERRAKAAEQFREESIVAAINEMRYAGRRIVDVIVIVENDDGSPATATSVSENVIVAKNYLINADHDITDATCFFAHKRFLRTIEQHGLKKIGSFLPEFINFYPRIQEAQEIVQGSREDRRKRLADYERLAEEYVPKVMDIYDKLSKIDELRVTDQIPRQLSLIKGRVDVVTFISIAGAVAGIIAVGLAIPAFKWAKHTDETVVSISSEVHSLIDQLKQMAQPQPPPVP